MGTTLYISLQQPIAGIEPNDDRVLLCRSETELAAIAGKIGVKPVTSFYGYDLEDVLGFIDDEDVQEQMRATAKPTPWFEADEALRSALALQGHVEANGPVLLKGRDVTTGVLDELESCITVLTAAKTAGVRFRMHPGE